MWHILIKSMVSSVLLVLYLVKRVLHGKHQLLKFCYFKQLIKQYSWPVTFPQTKYRNIAPSFLTHILYELHIVTTWHLLTMHNSLHFDLVFPPHSDSFIKYVYSIVYLMHPLSRLHLWVRYRSCESRQHLSVLSSGCTSVHYFNTLRLGEAYMRQCTRPSLV